MIKIENTKACKGDHAPHYGSPYPKDAVPESKFEKEPSAKNRTPYATCDSCRTWDKARKKKYRQNHKNNAAEATDRIKKGLSEFGYCINFSHGGAYPSIYTRDKVPVDMMRKIKGNENSELYLYCDDCRAGSTAEQAGRLDIVKAEAIKKGEILCTTCNQAMGPDRKQATNLDGSPSACCEPCKVIQFNKSDQKVSTINKVKTDTMKRNQCSCLVCKSVYVKPSVGSITVVRYDTYEIDAIRYMDINGIRYKVDYIIDMFSHLLELRILDFDHLTEKEQRDRGILKPGQPYVPKIDQVGNFNTEHGMIVEALKCQLICVRCHILQTMARESGEDRYNDMTLLARQKLDYVNSLKSAGCSCCGHIEPNFLRFFDMDHLDPDTKVSGIFQMIKDPNYTFEDVVIECAKCRVLCKFCHRIHTFEQRREKMVIRNAYRDQLIANAVQPATIDLSNLLNHIK